MKPHRAGAGLRRVQGEAQAEVCGKLVVSRDAGRSPGTHDASGLIRLQAGECRGNRALPRAGCDALPEQGVPRGSAAGPPPSHPRRDERRHRGCPRWRAGCGRGSESGAPSPLRVDVVAARKARARPLASTHAKASRRSPGRLIGRSARPPLAAMSAPSGMVFLKGNRSPIRRRQTGRHGRRAPGRRQRTHHA